MVRRFLILANPVAGGGRSKRLAPQLAQELTERGARTEVCFSEAAGDLGRRAAAVGPDDVNAIVSVGGDGTLNEVLNGLADPCVPLCSMALGTGNVLATELGLPRRPGPLAAILMAGRTLRAAIGLCERRRFLLFVSVGMDACIVERLEEMRSGPLTLGKAGWTRPVLETIWRWPLRQLDVRVGKREITGVSTALVTRVRNYGGVFRMPAEVDITDGHLHVLLFRQRSRWDYFRAVLRGIAGRLRPGRDLELLVGDQVEIRGPRMPAPYQVDGDLGGTVPVGQPLRISLLPQAARLFAGPAMIRQ